MKKYKLSELISLQTPTEDYSTGDLVVTNTTVVQFWGDIQRVHSPSVLDTGYAEDYTTNRSRDRNIVEVIARYRDIDTVEIGSELTFDSLSGTYSVSSIQDIDFKRFVKIIAQQTT